MRLLSVDREENKKRYIFQFSKNGITFFKFLDDKTYKDVNLLSEWVQSVIEDSVIE